MRKLAGEGLPSYIDSILGTAESELMRSQLGNSRWGEDSFLNVLRAHTDETADACVRALDVHKDYADIFRVAIANDSKLPADAPARLREFFAKTDNFIWLESDRKRFPDGLDHDRLKRGERVFLDHAFFASVVLLAKSLPEGYAAPCLSSLLNLSGNLRTKPYRRLLGVLQLVVDVSSLDGFDKGGRALAVARQARLMHAGIRRFAPAKLPDYETKYAGAPVNFEDMLGTIMGLSLLVIDGLPKLSDALREQEAEDYYYLWRAFAVAMGIHPPGQEGSAEWVPANLTEAREFYAAYERRHYVSSPAANADGVALAQENLNMLHHLMPGILRAIPVVNRIPDMFMTQLIGEEGCRRVGVEPYRVPMGLQDVAVGTLRTLIGIGRWLDKIDPAGNFHPTISTVLLQGMIKQQYGRVVTFEIPESIRQLHDLVDRQNSGSGTAAGTPRPAGT